jgi:hypothetical protein
MNEKIKRLWSWFCYERSGLLFHRVRGVRRIVIELSFFLAGAFVWYLWLSSVPTSGRKFMVSVLGSPFMDVSFVGFLCTAVLTDYMRDQLDAHRSLWSLLRFLVPGKVLQDYTSEYGQDSVVRALVRIRWASLGLFVVGACLIGLNHRSP